MTRRKVTLGGFTATGTVTYTFFSGANCSGTGTTGGTVTLDREWDGAQL